MNHLILYFKQVLGLSTVVVPADTLLQTSAASRKAMGSSVFAEKKVGSDLPLVLFLHVRNASDRESLFESQSWSLFLKMQSAMQLGADQWQACELTFAGDVASQWPELVDCVRLKQAKFIVEFGSENAPFFMGVRQQFHKEIQAWPALRGTLLRCEAFILLATFAPFHLLRLPQDKKTAWSDLQKMMKEISIETK